MHRIQSIARTALFVALFGAVALAGRRADAQEVVVNGGVGVTVDPSVVVEPSDEYIATVAPVYYEGRPVYYYNNYWYYRDHGRWRYYRTEPGYLRDHRAHWGDRGGYGGYGRGGGYVRGGYARGGAVRPATYNRGGYAHGGAVRGAGPARYHYRR